MITRNYTELSRLETFEERLSYLQLKEYREPSESSHDRYIKQKFYKSREFKQVCHHVKIRDNGCDLGVPGYFINTDAGDKALVHHMIPITVQDIVNNEPWVLDPEYLILTRHDTHNNIHYPVKINIPKNVNRQPGDTKLW